MLNFGRRQLYKGEEFGVERVVGELGGGRVSDFNRERRGANDGKRLKPLSTR